MGHRSQLRRRLPEFIPLHPGFLCCWELVALTRLNAGNSGNSNSSFGRNAKMRRRCKNRRVARDVGNMMKQMEEYGRVCMPFPIARAHSSTTYLQSSPKYSCQRLQSQVFDQVFNSELLDLLRGSVPPGGGGFWWPV